MTVAASKNRFPIDSALIIRAKGLAAVTADTNSTAAALDYDTSYWGSVNISDQQFALVLEVESATFSSHSYVFNFQISTDSAFTSPLTVVSVTPTATGRFTLLIPRERLNEVASTARYYRLQCDVTGSTPSIAYNAYLSSVI